MNCLNFRWRQRIRQSGNLEIFEDIRQGQEHVRLALKGNHGLNYVKVYTKKCIGHHSALPIEKPTGLELHNSHVNNHLE
jgi:hypothetical protein